MSDCTILRRESKGGEAMKLVEFFGNSRIERTFEESGLECCTRTHGFGHRCGYVAVREGHPLFGMYYGDVYDMDVDLSVDGGITFSSGDGDIWVFGWDAAHCWHKKDPSIMDEDYRKNIYEKYGEFHEEHAYMVDADMAERETRSFARQLAEMMPL